MFEWTFGDSLEILTSTTLRTVTLTRPVKTDNSGRRHQSSEFKYRRICLHKWWYKFAYWEQKLKENTRVERALLDQISIDNNKTNLQSTGSDTLMMIAIDMTGMMQEK